MMAAMKIACAAAVLLATTAALSQQPPNPLDKLIREKAPVIAITHVLVVDGTGAPAREDQTVVFDHGKIVAFGPSAQTPPPQNAKVIDGAGDSLLPGLVGMHEHLFYTGPSDKETVFIEQQFSFPQLYLAAGVTSARTTGAIEPYTDLEVKRAVDAGKLPGPDFFLTTPYVEGPGSFTNQMHALRDAQEAKEFVNYWHSAGFTSTKAYMDITPDELRAAIDESHKLGMKVTGHLCSVGYREAAEMGIDNLEHGPFGAPDAEWDPAKTPGVCGPNWSTLQRNVLKLDPNGPELKQTIDTLVAHHVAITSTLAVFEGGTRPPMDRDGLVHRAHELMSREEWGNVMTDRALETMHDDLETMLVKKEMAFERAFAKAGGTLAGCDPTGDGHTLAGLGDQREMELLVEAGFTPEEAAKIYTSNGAQFLGIADRVGVIAVGMQADLVLMQGNFVKDVSAIEHTQVVFKNGVGYDSQAIYDSLRGQVGLR
jgi:imidazolonepropionase-like amidohydrolase